MAPTWPSSAATLFETKRIYVTEAAQQPLVNLAMVLTDAGLALVLVALALFMLWRLFDLLQDAWSLERRKWTNRLRRRCGR